MSRVKLVWSYVSGAPGNAICVVLLLSVSLTMASCGRKDDGRKDDNRGSAQAQGNGQFAIEPSAEEIILEAEEAQIEPPMVVVIDDVSPEKSEIYHASCGKYVNVPDKSSEEEGANEDEGAGEGKESGEPEETAGKVTFRFDVEDPARYRLWARVNWLDGCGNSFNVVMDGGPPIMIGGEGTYKCWLWVRIPGSEGVFRLSSGKHALEFRNREDGASLDQILLTTDLDEQAQPQGMLAP